MSDDDHECAGCTALFCPDCRAEELWPRSVVLLVRSEGRATGFVDARFRSEALAMRGKASSYDVAHGVTTAELLEEYRSAYERGWNSQKGVPRMSADKLSGGYGGLRACSVCYGPCIHDDSNPLGRCASSGNTTLVDVHGPLERIAWVDDDGRMWTVSEVGRFLAGG